LENKMKVIILTGSELRHRFMRKAIALALGKDNFIVKSYCEGTEKSLLNLVKNNEPNSLKEEYLKEREKVESDFFSSFVRLSPDFSNPISIPKGAINAQEYVDEIIHENPDLIIAYGCSIIKSELIDKFAGRFLNAHLGLSPYYRGSGTNFWPLVNGEPEYVGVTFMYLDKGVDTGEIIHQIRARIYHRDTVHQIGNRLISDAAIVYAQIIQNFHNLKRVRQLNMPNSGKYYKNSDFTEASILKLYENFASGMIDKYLTINDNEKAPIVQNPILKGL